MIVLVWLLNLTPPEMLCLAATYWFIIASVSVMFAIRIGHVETLDDLLPVEGERE